MKYQATQTKFKSNNNLETLSLGINDTKKAIELLYSQYQFPIRTMVQELICNAFDAMQDAGKEDVPISVDLPRALNKYHFIVRDYGNSMTPDQIKNVYMRINASTKSNSNKAIGGFGIGSKTPWAYTESFILTTYVNGIERQYLMVRGRETISKVYEGKTDEPNGTKVTVKCERLDVERFEDAYLRAVLFAKTKPTCKLNKMLDLKEHYYVCDNVRVVEPNKFISSGDIYFSVGGVLYPTHNISNRFNYRSRHLYRFSLISNKALVINLPVSAMTPLQTREALDVSKKDNISMFKKVVRKSIELIKEQIKAEKDQVKDLKSAIDYIRSNTWYSMYFNKEFSGMVVRENGINFPEYNDKTFKVYTRKPKNYGGRNVRTRTEKTYSLNLAKMDHVYFCEKKEHISPNRRFNKLLGTIDFITVLDKDRFEDNQLYEKLKKILKAKDVFDLELEPVVRSSYNYTRPKRASNEVVFYNNDGSRKGVHDINNLQRKHVVLSKDYRLTWSHRELLESLGFVVSKVAPTNLQKVLASEMCFTVDQVKENVNVKKVYTINKALYSERKASLPRHVMNNLSENKRELFKTSVRTIEPRLYEEFFGDNISVDMKLFRKTKKRVLRARTIENKLELIENLPYHLINTKKGDELVKEYINFKLGVK